MAGLTVDVGTPASLLLFRDDLAGAAKFCPEVLQLW